MSVISQKIKEIDQEKVYLRKIEEMWRYPDKSIPSYLPDEY